MLTISLEEKALTTEGRIGRSVCKDDNFLAFSVACRLGLRSKMDVILYV